MAKLERNDAATTDCLEKIARLLAIAVTKDMSAEDAAIRLLSIGFDAQGIGAILGKNPNFAHAAKNRAKRRA